MCITDDNISLSPKYTVNNINLPANIKSNVLTVNILKRFHKEKNYLSHLSISSEKYGLVRRYFSLSFDLNDRSEGSDWLRM